MQVTRTGRDAVVALTLVVGAATACAPMRAEGQPFSIGTNTGGGGFHDEVGAIGIGPIATVKVTAPFTIVRVRPLHIDADTDLLAVRAWFHGFGVTPGGYRRNSGLPGGVCANGPITGHGPSYPVEGLQLKPGDNPKLVVYAKPRTAGKHVVTGYVIDYRMPGRPTRTVRGESGFLEMNLHPPGDTGYLGCQRYDGYTRPRAGYPN